MKRRAVVKVHGLALGYAAGVFIDHGLEIEGSRHSDDGMIVLVVAGDALPDACEGLLREVVPLISHERYGSQFINRITDFQVFDEWRETPTAAAA